MQRAATHLYLDSKSFRLGLVVTGKLRRGALHDVL